MPANHCRPIFRNLAIAHLSKDQFSSFWNRTAEWTFVGLTRYPVRRILVLAYKRDANTTARGGPRRDISLFIQIRNICVDLVRLSVRHGPYTRTKAL